MSGSRRTSASHSVPHRAASQKDGRRQDLRPTPVRVRLARLLRRLLGLKRRFEVDGVRYKELSTTSIDRALSPRGKGRKRYEVRFPAGRPMTINATADRRYADLMDVPELRSIRLVENLVRPGSRVLILGSGTGGMAEMVSRWIGPHGGLVAIDHDNESIRFARRRYRLESTSFERGGIELLEGELDGSFEVVIITRPWLRQIEQPANACNEAWRVTGPGGILIIVGDGIDKLLSEPGTSGAQVRTIAPPDGGPTLLILERPEPKRPEAESR